MIIEWWRTKNKFSSKHSLPNPFIMDRRETWNGCRGENVIFTEKIQKMNLHKIKYVMIHGAAERGETRRVYRHWIGQIAMKNIELLSCENPFTNPSGIATIDLNPSHCTSSTASISHWEHFLLPDLKVILSIFCGSYTTRIERTPHGKRESLSRKFNSSDDKVFHGYEIQLRKEEKKDRNDGRMLFLLKPPATVSRFQLKTMINWRRATTMFFCCSRLLI